MGIFFVPVALLALSSIEITSYYYFDYRDAPLFYLRAVNPYLSAQKSCHR
jgi:hypothetical protein